jgi:phosphohistidine phosphatase
MSFDLYIVRHAIAFERDPVFWPDDRERPLTDEGVKKFEAAAKGLKRVAPKIDALVSSPLVRAAQTAGILVKRTGWPAPTMLEALSPETPPEETLDALAPLADRGSLAIVGHEPHLSSFTAFLLTGNAAWPLLEYKKGGVALLRFENGLQSGAGSLQWVLPPKVLRLLAG